MPAVVFSLNLNWKFKCQYFMLYENGKTLKKSTLYIVFFFVLGILIANLGTPKDYNYVSTLCFIFVHSTRKQKCVIIFFYSVFLNITFRLLDFKINKFDVIGKVFSNFQFSSTKEFSQHVISRNVELNCYFVWFL